ncbi:helix-turn-helix domain-containing protein [Pseudofulvimonas gallinarii]|uniref:helix-turn-helix domain-containing protein n=1 Tax=Pseudofulvimonas gallinarii TaxID=634155 RepID=UPI000F49F3C6|nr:helix-turn-helix transcriptional regulator [Pseudofulvimonas gallinarii]THD12621.1 transcriptional regulator [Pseudofulvimonas gallinarii]
MKPDEVMNRLGSAIRARREALNVSQEAFADMIEMHRTYYSAIERGEKNLQLSTLLRVSQGLGVTLSVVCLEAGV